MADKVKEFHRVDACPKCGWPTLARKGRTVCCKAKLWDVHETTLVKKRRCRTRKEKIEATGAETEGAANVRPLSVSAGQLALFETGE